MLKNPPEKTKAGLNAKTLLESLYNLIKTGEKCSNKMINNTKRLCYSYIICGSLRCIDPKTEMQRKRHIHFKSLEPPGHVVQLGGLVLRELVL